MYLQGYCVCRPRTRLFLGLWFLGTVLGSRGGSICNTGQIHSTSDQMVLHTRQILGSAASDINDRVFLAVVSDTWDVCRHHLAVGQSHSCSFSLCWIWFLWLENHDSQDHTLLDWTIFQMWRLGWSVLSCDQSTSLSDLIQRGISLLVQLQNVVQYQRVVGLIWQVDESRVRCQSWGYQGWAGRLDGGCCTVLYSKRSEHLWR